MSVVEFVGKGIGGLDGEVWFVECVIECLVV